MNINHETAEQRIGRLVREAAGTQPVKNAFFSKDRQFDDTFRGQFRNLLHLNQEYVTEVKNTDISATAKLMTPDSFVDPAISAIGLKQLHAVYDLDMGQEQKVHEILDGIRHIIETNDWSASEKQTFIDNFDKGVAQALANRQRGVAAEKAWVAAIDDAYGYADRNRSAFVLNNGHLLFSDNEILEGFNSRMRTIDARHTDFMHAQQEFNNFQKGLFQKMGVSSKDVGLP